MLYIAIRGKKRSGKDTVAEYISKVLHLKGKSCMIYKLAIPLKEGLVNGSKGRFSFEDIDGLGIDREMILDYDVPTLLELFKNALKYNGIDKRISDDELLKFINSFDIKSWSLRTIMQRYGTDLVCNMIDTMHWTNTTLNYCDLHSSKNDVTIITDVRQEWEDDALRNKNALMISIENNDINTIDTHSTEIGIMPKDGDIIIENKGTLDELYKKLDKLILKKVIKYV